MSAHLQGINSCVWEICEDLNYTVLAARVGQDQIDQHNANSKARTVLFSSLSMPEFERVQDLRTARDIWEKLQSYHEGTPQVKTQLYEAYRKEYENFVHLPGESIDSLFSRFHSLLNKMRANRAQLPYTNPELARKLLHCLDKGVWGTKVEVLTESPSYETLTLDELFSKLKSSEVDKMGVNNPTTPSMSLVSGKGVSNSFANPSQSAFVLSSLLTMTEEQLEVLGMTSLLW